MWLTYVASESWAHVQVFYALLVQYGGTCLRHVERERESFAGLNKNVFEGRRIDKLDSRLNPTQHEAAQLVHKL